MNEYSCIGTGLVKDDSTHNHILLTLRSFEECGLGGRELWGWTKKRHTVLIRCLMILYNDFVSSDMVGTRTCIVVLKRSSISSHLKAIYLSHYLQWFSKNNFGVISDGPNTKN